MEDLKSRTKRFALAVITLYSVLPKRVEATIIGKQLLRSGTSVGAQYCEACRSKSNADFISKLEGSLQELEESLYWIELLEEAKFLNHERAAPLKSECSELNAIFTTIVIGRKKAR